MLVELIDHDHLAPRERPLADDPADDQDPFAQPPAHLLTPSKDT